MKERANILGLIYELFDEIIGGIIPGIYFCTYFLICALLIVYSNDKFDCQVLKTSLIAILFFSVSYVIGTLFKKGDMTKTDIASVKYILKKQKYNTTHNEFMCIIDEQYYKETIKKVEGLKNNCFIPISIPFLNSKKRIWQINNNSTNKMVLYIIRRLRLKLFFLIQIKFVLNPIILLLRNHSRLIKIFEKNIEEIEKLYLELNDRICFEVKYPYRHLKQYLESNGLNDLSKYVDWNSNEQVKSKSFINEMLFSINDTNFYGKKEIKKRSAHIRFMNSSYHSQKHLFRCVLSISVAILLIFITRFTLIYMIDFSHSKEKPNPTQMQTYEENEVDKKIQENITQAIENNNKKNYVILKLFRYIERIVNYETMFFILCISILYILFYFIMRNLILGNFHLQRIHEIEYLLEAKNYIDSKSKKVEKI